MKRLLLNYISQPRVPFSSTSQSYFYNEVQSGVLQRVGSAAGSCADGTHLFIAVYVYMTSLVLTMGRSAE